MLKIYEFYPFAEYEECLFPLHLVEPITDDEQTYSLEIGIYFVACYMLQSSFGNYFNTTWYNSILNVQKFIHSLFTGSDHNYWIFNLTEKD